MKIQKFLNQFAKPTTAKNEYVPVNGVCDAYRKERFDHYNVDLMNQIRHVKLNRNETNKH